MESLPVFGLRIAIGEELILEVKSKAPAQAEFRKESHKISIQGLENPVEIIVDSWGVPHIYATNKYDVYVGQGFQAARDRLFQIDIWRRRGLGKLSAVLGEKYIDQDFANRQFLFRGDQRTEWLSYSTDAKDIVTAFVSGVNAFIAWVLESPDTRLPQEFSVLGMNPEYWNPEDISKIRTHGLLSNAEQEVQRALTIRDLGREAEGFRSAQVPDGSRFEVEDAGFEALDDSTLKVYWDAFAPVEFGNRGELGESEISGSNNWVIAGDRTETGRPLLANDPHRVISSPSLRYMAHLNAPGMNVIGAGEPHLPGISIGHNDNVAFGLTIWGADQEDIYIYDLHPDNDDQYFYNNGWERIESVKESFEVKGNREVVRDLLFTRHGPVLKVDLENRKLVAIRAAWLEPGMSPYLGSLEFQAAKDAEEFRKGLRRWGAPTVNMNYATTDGDIGWQACGLIPKRKGWDGSAPVKGNGSFEWDGFVFGDDLPRTANPEQGWFTTSNQFNIPKEYQSNQMTYSTDWASDARHEVLTEWLKEDTAVGISKSIQMQADVSNVHALRLLARLSKIKPNRRSDVWRELQNWDGQETANSRATLVYQIWESKYFRPWLVDLALTELGLGRLRDSAARDRLLRQESPMADIRPEFQMLSLFDLSDAEVAEIFNEGIGQTLDQTLQEISLRLGSSQEDWTWGNLHQLNLIQPVLDSQCSDESKKHFEPIGRGGSGDSVGMSGYDAEFNVVVGSSFRMNLDVGNWDECVAINMPGQSGNPSSKHFDDLLPLWSSDDVFPLLFSREAIEESVSQRIELIPESECSHE